VNVCANCNEGIMWMHTLNAWIHRSTGRITCDVHRPGRLVAISGRREMRATPSRRRAHRPCTPGKGEPGDVPK
jgi:hypothetical protein